MKEVLTKNECVALIGLAVTWSIVGLAYIASRTKKTQPKRYFSQVMEDLK